MGCTLNPYAKKYTCTFVIRMQSQMPGHIAVDKTTGIEKKRFIILG